MSRSKSQKLTKKSRIVARLIGMALMVAILVILGIIGLKFLQGMDTKGNSQPPAAKKETVNKKQTVAKPETKKPRYDFYDELSGRKAEVDAEIKERIADGAKLSDVKGSNYRIQVGAFREQEQANRMRARMILRDYPVTILRSGKFYLVQVGPYKEKNQAEAVQKKLKREGVDTLLKSYVGD